MGRREDIGSGQRISDREAIGIARHVTWVGFWCNAALGGAKVAAGIVGRSGALVADGIHSFSDFISDILVLVMVGIARRKPDRGHEFGHGRYETMATILLSLALLIVAIGIAVDAGDKIMAVIHGRTLPEPGMIALIICAASIAVKEWLYHYTRRAGRRIHSEAVIANAWHHRSDAFSSIATLIGVAGAMFLGREWRVLDPVAALIVAIFIAILSIRMAGPSMSQLLGRSLPTEQQEHIKKALASTAGIITYHHLRTATSGADVIVDVHIKVNGCLTVNEAHEIASEAERRIHGLYPDVNVMVSTHIEPYKGETIYHDGSCRD
ncbi:MAG: cation diffusion facilitator family transporter [Bacteroidales bacterium]|nr:cation diffusion facilitator family transporter [Bacteroidales bacterium]